MDDEELGGGNAPEEEVGGTEDAARGDLLASITEERETGLFGSRGLLAPAPATTPPVRRDSYRKDVRSWALV